MRQPVSRDIGAAAVCVAFGILLSTLPHLVWWQRLDGPIWVSDSDELGVYLSLGSRAYFNHPAQLDNRNRDGCGVEGGASTTPWLQVIPGVLVAKALHLGPLGISLVWRTWAGLSIALGWYLVLRHYVPNPLVAAAATIFLLADIGLLYSTLLVRQVSIALRLMMDDPRSLFDDMATIHIQWRIANPGLSMGFFLLYIWLLSRARTKCTRARVIWSGLGLGLLFHVYFYHWTAAVLALLLAMGLDVGHRKAYFHTAWIGGLVGLPAVVSGLLIKQSSSSEWLHRSDYFIPISRFSELLFPRVMIALMIAGLVWTWFRRWDLIHLWCLAASGLALANHQLITGLQIQNFHWLAYVAGPTLSLLLMLSILGELSERGLFSSRPVVWGLLALCGAHLAVGIWLRAVEANRTRQSVEILANYQRYRTQRHGRGDVAMASRAVVAGDPAFVDLAVILENQRPLDHYRILNSSSVDNSEWDARIVLNDYLLGADPADFEDRQAAMLTYAGPWGRDPRAKEERLASRLASYNAIRADPTVYLDKFCVRYVALPAGRPLPAYLDRGWRPFEEGPYWDIWERR